MGTTDNRPTDAAGTGAGGKSKNSGTGSAANSRGTGTGTGTTGAAGTANKPAQKSVGLSNVTVDVPTPAEPKRGRGRPPGSTKKKNEKKKTEAAATIDPTHFVVLLQTISNVLASREGMEMFALSKQEAEQIATPLAAILAKHNAVGEFAGEYADHIALLTACGAIFVPKFLLWQLARKERIAMIPKTKEGQEHDKAGTTTRSAAKPTGTSRDTNHVQNDVHTFNGSINDVIMPVI